ncbi:hypothetical protein [Mesorhizobium sp. M0589]
MKRIPEHSKMRQMPSLSRAISLLVYDWKLPQGEQLDRPSLNIESADL